jgi:hypothetical protein
MLLLHKETLSNPSVNNAYRNKGSFTFTHLGRAACRDWSSPSLWTVAFNFCGIFLPLCSCYSSCHSKVYISPNHTNCYRYGISELSYELFPVMWLFSVAVQLSRFTDRHRDQKHREYKIKYGDGDVTYVSHSFIQVQNNICNAIHKCHPNSNMFYPAWEGWIKNISLAREFSQIWWCPDLWHGNKH